MKEEKITEIVADLMTISAQTSPKSSEDLIETIVLDMAEKEMLAEELFQLSDEFQDDSYSKEGEEIEASDEILIVGLKDHEALGNDCKACGFESCEEFSKADQIEDIFQGPNCIYPLIDLGMSIGRALNTAENHNLEYSVSIKGGMAAKNLGLVDSKVCLVVPVDVAVDKIYFSD